MAGQPSHPVFDSTELRRSVIDACRFLRGIGHFIGTWGNIGVRVEDGLLVTPTRMDYDAMQPDDLVVVSWEGVKIKGHRLPTSEMELHRLLLLNRPDLGAMVHTHAPYASCVASTQQSLPVCVEDMSQIIGGTVNCSRYVPGGHHRELAEAAWAAMGAQAAAVLLANHGVAVGGRDLAEALVGAQILEKAAMIHVLAGGLGGAKEIPPHFVAEERHRFLHKYGTANDVPGHSAS